MYSVAIADDEVCIREGLRDLVEWHKLGSVSYTHLAHIFYRNPGAFPEGHGKIAVISPRWIYIDRQRRHKGRRIPAAAKEIS